VLDCWREFPDLISIVASAFKRRWRKLGILIAVPPGIFLVLWVITAGIDRVDYRAQQAAVYDTPVEFGQPIYEFHSEQAFNGDGYSIEVYELPLAIRKRFEAADSRLLIDFPQRSHFRHDWDVIPWREAPMDPAFAKYRDFALSPWGKHDSRLGEQLVSIESALRREGTFYACFKYDHVFGEARHLGNIDLFVVDLERGRVYEINCNT